MAHNFGHTRLRRLKHQLKTFSGTSDSLREVANIFLLLKHKAYNIFLMNLWFLDMWKLKPKFPNHLHTCQT